MIECSDKLEILGGRRMATETVDLGGTPLSQQTVCKYAAQILLLIPSLHITSFVFKGQFGSLRELSKAHLPLVRHNGKLRKVALMKQGSVQMTLIALQFTCRTRSIEEQLDCRKN